MQIIGIDPGTTETAVVIYSGEGRIDFAKKISNEEAAALLTTLVPETVKAVYVEHMQCFGMPVGAETFETCYFIGELKRICKERGIPFKRVFRSDIKMNYCRTTRATDANIRQALIDIFGPPGVKKAPGRTYGIVKDVWSALAISYYGWVREAGTTFNHNAFDAKRN